MKVRIKRLPQARTGYQVQGALRNDVPAMGGADYNAYIGEPKLKGSKYITKVPRDEANLEAEGGETVFGDINGDGMPEHKIIKGPRHAQGGVPLSLPDDTFIFSDFNGMKLKDSNLLGMFGKGGATKGFTPAELAKQYDIEKYRKILQDPESDTIDRKTAELMLKNYTLKLGALALAQESKKGFPQGIPAVARPYMEANNIKEEDLIPTEVNALNEQIDAQYKQNEASAETEASPTEEQDMMSGVDQAQEMNQGQPVAQPSQEEMMRYGGFRRLRRAQEGMQQQGQPSEEDMAMMQQQGQQQGGGDQMQQMMQQIGQALEQGAQPEDVIAQLLQSQVPPQAIMQIFVQLGMPEEQVGSAIQSVMAELQGGQEEMAEGPQGQNPQEEMMEAPMAQYGMSMGGYDMPFYDMPRAQGGYNLVNESGNVVMPDPNYKPPGVPKTYDTADYENMNPAEQYMMMKDMEAYPDSYSEEERSRFAPREMTQEEIDAMNEANPPMQMPAIPENRYGGMQMAQYGMSMGGYDMPFYDMPEAEYGMSMGANPQNYQGRKRDMRGSGPMFYQNGGNLPKAQGGITIKRGDYKTEDEFQRALYDAYNKKENKGKSIYIDDNGKTKQFKGYKKKLAEDYGTEKLDDWGPATRDAERKQAAAQYMLIKKGTDNPKIRQKIIDETRAALDDCRTFIGKSKARAYKSSTGKDLSDQDCATITGAGGVKTWESRGYGKGKDVKDQDIINSYLDLQRRNIKINNGYGINSKLFTDQGTGLKSAQLLVDKAVVNPDTNKPFANVAEATAWRNKFAKEFNVSPDKLGTEYISEKVGEPLANKEKNALQQATFHGYARMVSEFSTKGDDPNYDPDLKYALRNYIPDVNVTSTGQTDENTMAKLYPGFGSIITPVDSFGDVANKSDQYRHAMGDTTSGMIGAAYTLDSDLLDIPEGCQCTDPTQKETYMAPDAEGNCPCDLPKDKPKTKPCDCEKSDGTKIDTGVDPNTGECNPCEEEVGVDVAKPPASWWLQDTIKTTGAFGDLMGIKKYLPWAPKADLETPRPTFMDPTRELAANAEQANIQTQGVAQFAGPQGLSARSASIQGQASKNAADVLSKYNNANVNIANQFEFKTNDIRNQEQMLNQAANTKAFDQTTIANQQFDNAKLAMRGQLRNYYNNAVTNRWKTDALNQMYPQYGVDPSVGGRMDFKEGKQFKPEQTSGMTWEQAYEWCKTEGEKNPSECASRKMAAQGGGGTQTDNRANMIKTIYKQKGGDANGGFVYADMMYPFIL